MLHRFADTLLRPGISLASTNSSRLERWLGAAAVQKLSDDMRGWYGPPIAVHGVPGSVFATGDGDFVGHCDAGEFGSHLDRAQDLLRRMGRKLKWRVSRGMKVHHGRLYAGFASLDDLISEATNAGKRYTFNYQKAGGTGVVGVTNSLYRLGNQPVAGAAPGNAPGGTAFTDASTGGHLFLNPTGGDTLHIVGGNGTASVAGNSLLLYDLLFGCNKAMNSTATEAVTGVPTRYQNQTGGTADYIGGNFLAVHVGGTALAATAHNWTVCTYTDQGGAASTLPSLTGNSGAIVDRLDHPIQQWFAPLESGDVGIKALTQMQCSAAVATGVIWFMIGHPIAFIQFPVANFITTKDYIQTAFNLVRIFDDAFLTLLEVIKPATGATTYNVQFDAVAG